MVGFSLIPAFGTLYQRLTLPESTRFKKSQGIENEEVVEEIELQKRQQEEEIMEIDANPETDNTNVSPTEVVKPTKAVKQMSKPRKSHIRGIISG